MRSSYRLIEDGPLRERHAVLQKNTAYPESAKNNVRYPDLIEESIGETLTYYAFPDSHWSKIRTNNLLERIMKEIRSEHESVPVS